MIFCNIVKLCNDKGISIYKLEETLGFSNGTIRKWKESDPSASRLKAVADFFGVTIDDLFKDMVTKGKSSKKDREA